jgi:hypothetical protein
MSLSFLPPFVNPWLNCPIDTKGNGRRSYLAGLRNLWQGFFFNNRVVFMGVLLDFSTED